MKQKIRNEGDFFATPIISSVRAIKTNNQSYQKLLGVFLGGCLITACSSVQVSEDGASGAAPVAEEQTAKPSQVENTPAVTEKAAEAPKAPVAPVEVSSPEPAPVAEPDAPVETAKANEAPAEVAVAEPVSEPMSEPVSEPVSEPMSEPMAEPVKEVKAVAQPEQASSPAPVPAAAEPTEVAEQAKAAAAVATFKASSVPKDTRKWKIEKNWDAQNPKRCKASSPTFQVVNEGYATQVWLNIIVNELHVHTTTHVDITKDSIGVKPSNGEFAPFSSKTSETSAIWSGDIVAAMNSSDTLSIVIGGDGLGDRIHTATVNVTGLKAVYADYVKCKD